ncbi:hypothetical protein CANINC_000676 [Pichia inconspicua]|uniref:Rad21/Rec8-like protein N-terminal domain-containing protein n=1 Tax=Pichia inconspicua TaxID=52247 RepID=A0A4V4NG64_9ASCO|nr:hypothetical protein CANINC_000676 [[Candida] inconspicua]
MASKLYDPTNPLSPAWLASILEKKLTKQQYLRTSIPESTKAIENNTIVKPAKEIDVTASQVQLDTQNGDSQENNEEGKSLTLRISGQLLYGVVKIYSRKTRYLHDDVSVSLIQLKSAFSLSKSMQLDTSVVELDKVLLKDNVEEIGILYNDFNLNDIFQGGANSNDVDNTSIEYTDMSVGRGAVEENEEELGNTTIDGLSRRAVVTDDLDDIPEFDLPLDFDKVDEGRTEEMDVDIQDAVNDIADFQIDAIDNMNLEFTIDDTIAEQNERDEVDEEEVVDTTHVLRKPKRKYTRQSKEYENMEVVRTQRRRLVVDDKQVEISTEELKRNQREWPNKRELNRATISVYKVDGIDLVPEFMKRIGVSWSSIKRRRIENENIDYVDQSIPDFDVTGYEQDEQVDENEQVTVIEPVIVPAEEEEVVFEEPEEVEEPVEEEVEELELESTPNEGVDILSKLDSTNSFKEITRYCEVSAAASTFFNLLVLATSNKVDVRQERLFGDIKISIK